MTALDDNGLAWQIGVWDRMAQPYQRALDRCFASVVGGVVARAKLRAGERVLDLGAGTGSITIRAAALVGDGGHVTGVDISREMLVLARGRASALSLGNVTFREGRAEAVPVDSSSFDAALASLSLMYVIDRAAAAREIARVLRPGGRFVAAVWAAPADCDTSDFRKPPLASLPLAGPRCRARGARGHESPAGAAGKRWRAHRRRDEGVGV